MSRKKRKLRLEESTQEVCWQGRKLTSLNVEGAGFKNCKIAWYNLQQDVRKISGWRRKSRVGIKARSKTCSLSCIDSLALNCTLKYECIYI